MRRLVITALAVLLGGCGKDSPPVVLQPAFGNAPTPTSALAAIDLAPVLIANGDLPPDYTLEPLTSQGQAPYSLPGLSVPDARLIQSFNNRQAMSGYGSIILYRDQTVVSDMYSRMVKNMGTAATILSGLGEQATQVADPADPSRATKVVFIRCHALVELQGYSARTAAPGLLVTWAQKIDQRSQYSAICQ